MAKIIKTYCVTGPESTGKSALSQALSREFNFPWSQEYAREYLQYDPKYTYDDLYLIAQGQLQKQLEVKNAADTSVIWDTDLLTLVIWSKYVYGKVNMEVYRMWKQNLPDVYLLCNVDLPWEFDELREHPHHRHKLFNFYLKWLKKSGIPFYVVEGVGSRRIENAVELIQMKQGIKG
ncbi:MAG: ATP-binding protein [Cryomorphaceae bacterium]|nr:ATP-binding protein [Cryomorphaceae bacterium]